MRSEVSLVRPDEADVRGIDRPYNSFGSFFLTITTFGGAAWVFLVGSALPSVGDTRLAIVGFICGLFGGGLVCLLGAALPAFAYGVDSVGVSRAFLGARGALLCLVGVLLTAIAWSAVLASMIARGLTMLIESESGAGHVDQRLCLIFYVAVLGLCWMLLRRGYHFVLRASDIAGPIFLVLAAVCFVLLVYRFGLSDLWRVNVEPKDALTGDHRTSLSYAFEFGLTFALAWWPFIGGLHRLVRHARHTVNPFMLGTLSGAGLCSIVAALGAVHFGSADPIVWILRLAGPVVGKLMVAVILLMNVAAIGLLVYFGAESIQQMTRSTRLRWDALVAIVLLPVGIGMYNTDWVLVHVTAVASYGGLIFLGISTVAIVDFHVLRRQALTFESLDSIARGGSYWFWGGVNWVAILVIALGMIGYLAIYDPITLAAKPVFRYFGAGLPILLASGSAYYLLTRWIVIPSGRGDYRL